MTKATQHDATRLLRECVDGGTERAGELFSLLYGELRALAGAIFREQDAGLTLEPTAVVHEAFVRLVRGEARPRDRQHFFALAARAMRSVLVDHARAKAAEKRGGQMRRVTLSGVDRPIGDSPLDVLILDEALTQLAALDERQARLVELRFFSGLTMDECAEELNIARSTAAQQWRFARAWLSRRLRAETGA